MPLRVALLGDGSITDAVTGEVRTRSSRSIVLVGYLVVRAGTTQPRQRIAGLFWPESGDAQALTNLRRELHGLRRVLDGQPCLDVSGQGLGWRDAPAVTVDLLAFRDAAASALAARQAGDLQAAAQHADAALAHYAGGFLPGFDDEWILEARTDLQRDCVELCALVCRARRALGDPAAAFGAARRRVRLEPLEEAGYQTLMQLQADAGDRAGAVSTYHWCASVLERELGVVPGPAIRAALQRVMGQQVRPVPSPAAEGATAEGSAAEGATAEGSAAEGEAAGRGRRGSALVGRADEFAVLRGVWRRAAAGQPQVVVVRGDAGVGKTRLVTEAADAARRQGAAVATSQCFGTSGRLALAPVADWLRSPVVRAGHHELDAVWREEVERLVPTDGGRADAAAGQRAMVDAWQRHRFFEGLARALLAVHRPTLLVLDNLQWCDQETLAFLAFFLGLAVDAPVLVAATLRVDSLDDEPEVRQWLARLRSAGAVAQVALEPLKQDDTVQLAEAISGRSFPPSEHAVLQGATGGFPLHIVEAMRAVEGSPHSTLPQDDLAAVLRGRLQQAGSAAQEVAGLAAAVGRDFTLDLLAEASDLTADSVVAAVDELWRRRILRTRGERYDFSHDLIRDAAYAQVTLPRRWLLHRRLAQGLELLHADDLAPVGALLAEQYARGGRPEKALAYYRRAAESAEGIFAHAEAVRLLDAALAIVRAQPPSQGSAAQELALLESMAAPRNAWQGYASVTLQRVLERSIVLSESLGRSDSLVSALVGMWGSLFVQGRIGDSRAAAERAMALVEPDSERGGAARFALAGALLTAGEPSASLPYFELAAESTDEPSLHIGTRPDVHAKAWVAHARWLLGDQNGALASARQAIERARAVARPYPLAVAFAYVAVTHQLRADTADLPGAVDELEELCRRYEFGYYREWGLVLRGWCLGGASGLALARRGVQNLRSQGSFARMPYWLTLLADLQARAGLNDDARSTLDAALVGARAQGDLWWLPEVLRLRAKYEPDPRAAAEQVRQAQALATAHGSLALVRRCDDDLARLGVEPG